ncbi:adenylosuccinate lyase [Roseivivax halodurans]|nr:adenylosuccinate lyase [Roseivivax halodurans]
MTLKTLLTACTLTVVSAIGASAECGWQKQAMSCADGMTYDRESGTCVVVSG